MRARTLEVCDDLGIVDEVLAAGRRVYGVNVYAREVGGRADRVAYLGLRELDSLHPFMLRIPQPETE